MNLQKLFELQRQLDEHIEREHPRKPGEDRLAKKILALMVELGEFANEHRGFKYWSNDQEPRTSVTCNVCKGKGFLDVLCPFSGEVDQLPCEKCKETGKSKGNPLLEEYVDALHFILSIGNDINMNEVYEDDEPKPLYCEDIIDQFIAINHWINSLYFHRHEDVNGEIYHLVFVYLLGLGKMLGFSSQEIEETYLRKNRENHQRQESGY